MTLAARGLGNPLASVSGKNCIWRNPMAAKLQLALGTLIRGCSVVSMCAGTSGD